MLPTNCENSYLEVILGPMFAGKTSRIIEIHNHCSIQNIPVYVINHSLDKRYSDKDLVTHDNLSIPATNIEKLTDLLENTETLSGLLSSRVILINEGQFFNDLLEFVIAMVEKYNKQVYVCGLDGDFKRNKFGQILDLIPYADNIVKLKSVCKSCDNGAFNNEAIFTSRYCNSECNTGEQVIIGGIDIYEPVCRKCYISKMQYSK